jgi:hypothetical protein
MRWFGALAAAALLSGCATSTPSAQGVSPSPVISSFPAASSSPVARQVLPPARSLPVVALCSQPVTLTQDGGAAPLTCDNGALNVLAWKFYAGLSPRVLSAGTAATDKAVRTAMCADWIGGHATAPEERSAYELSAAYYGWNFDTDPTDLLFSTCR